MSYTVKRGLGEFRTRAEQMADNMEFLRALWSTRGICEFEAGPFTIGPVKHNNGSCVPGRAYFEHNEYGDECGGGLWFDGSELDDYDGVGCLPRAVGRALRELGITVDDSCFADQEPNDL